MSKDRRTKVQLLMEIACLRADLDKAYSDLDSMRGYADTTKRKLDTIELLYEKLQERFDLLDEQHQWVHAVAEIREKAIQSLLNCDGRVAWLCPQCGRAYVAPLSQNRPGVEVPRPAYRICDECAHTTVWSWTDSETGKIQGTVTAKWVHADEAPDV